MVAQRDPMEEGGRQVEERASVLIEEFREHYQDCVRQHPDQHGHDGQRLIFEGWMIQKIAGLQIAIEQIALRFNAHVDGKAADP